MRRGRASQAACGFAAGACVLLALAGCASEPESRATAQSSMTFPDRAAPRATTATALSSTSDDAPPLELNDGGYARDPSPRDPGRYWVAPDPDHPGRSRVVEVSTVAQRSPRPADAVPEPPAAPPAADPGDTPHLVEVKTTK